jgi:hypothetical protein
MAKQRGNKQWATWPRRSHAWGLLGGAALGFALQLHSGDALGFCRSTSCDPTETVCLLDENGCGTVGFPLYWPSTCVTFGVHDQGSPLRGVTFREAERAAAEAFRTWLSADCGNGQHPSIGAVSKGEVFCAKVEYNNNATDSAGQKHVAGPNANLIVFRDVDWPFLAGAGPKFAQTTVTFAKSSGEILDADIELNSRDVEFSTSDTDVRVDLQAVLTHELGHFFGLSHSSVPGATMDADYNASNLAFRTLSADDQAAICEAYPPLPLAVPVGTAGMGAAGSAAEDALSGVIDCRGQEPRFGFSRYCGENVLADGCAAVASKRAGLSGVHLLAAAALLFASSLRLRRRAT